MFLIDSIGLYPQSAVILYIYMVGNTYSAKNSVYRSKSIKNSNYSRIPSTPVGPTGQTGRAPAGLATAPDQSDRSVRPVDANFGCQQKLGEITTLLQHKTTRRMRKQPESKILKHELVEMAYFLMPPYPPRSGTQRARAASGR